VAFYRRNEYACSEEDAVADSSVDEHAGAETNSLSDSEDGVVLAMVDGLSPQAHTPRTSAPPVLSRLVVGRHISTDGGLIRAAKFLVEPLRNGELQGASLNIIVTKKSVDGGLSETPRMYAKQLRSRDAQNQDKRFLIKQLLKMDMDEYRVRIFRRMTAGLGEWASKW